MIRNLETQALAETLQEELIRCFGDPGAVLTEDILAGAFGVITDHGQDLFASVSQRKVSASVWMLAFVLRIGDFVEALTLAMIGFEQLLGMNVNVSGIDILPLEGTKLACTHTGLDSQQNCISAKIRHLLFQFLLNPHDLTLLEDFSLTSFLLQSQSL